jgi:hypothetical protein
MFNNIQIKINPSTLVRKNGPVHDDFTFNVVVLEGEYYKVFPETAREVFYLQGLTKGHDIHVTESGDGIIVNKAPIDAVKHL